MVYFGGELQIYSLGGVSYVQCLAFVLAQLQTLAKLSPGLLLKIMNSGKSFGVEVINIKKK